MPYINAIAELLGGLGAFFLGFKLLSDGMSKLANKGLKRLFAKTTNKPVVGMGVGALSTAILQSSGITTVMVVGFVNAGIMSLPQATAVIIGSNIGTTITAQLAALQSIQVLSFLMILAFVGAAMALFAKKDKSRTLGTALGGLGLVFIAMAVMSQSMTTFKEMGTLEVVLQGIQNPFLLLLIGIVATAIFQSSSAVTSILISMAAAGLAIGGGGNNVLYVVLGSNIGSCVTALLSSIGTGTNARRASLIHLLFNVFGVIIFTIMLLLWRDFFDDTFVVWFPNLPATQIAMFHTFFNTVCMLIFLPMSKILVWISTVLVKDKNHLPIKKDYMDERLLKTPAIALSQLNKEMVFMAESAFNNLTVAFDAFIKEDTSVEQAVAEASDKVEKIGNEMVDYLVKISAGTVSISDEKLINQLHHDINDAMRINAFSDNIVKYTKKAVLEDLEFSSDMKAQLSLMFEEIKNLFAQSVKAFSDGNEDAIKQVDIIEEKIDAYKKMLIDGHIERLNKGVCKPENSGVFINLVSNLERAADHLTFFAHSVEEQSA